MPELLLNITDTINIIQNSKLEERKPSESGMLDRLWRRTLKMPESPKRSMLRSVSSSRRKHSRSRSASLETRAGETSQAEEYAEMIVQAVKAVMAKHLTGVDLQDHIAGEIKLSQGRLSGLWKLSRGGGGGGECQIDCGSEWNILSFSVVVRGLQSSYHFRSASRYDMTSSVISRHMTYDMTLLPTYDIVTCICDILWFISRRV